MYMCINSIDSAVLELVLALSVSMYCTILYYTVLYYTILTILYSTVLYYILYCTILYCIILYYTILYCIILYTILYYTVLYCTVYTVFCLLYCRYVYNLYTLIGNATSHDPIPFDTTSNEYDTIE